MAVRPVILQVGQRAIDQERQALAPDSGPKPSLPRDPAYRSRMVTEPRTVLAEMGLDLDDDVEIRVHDSNNEVRWESETFWRR